MGAEPDPPQAGKRVYKRARVLLSAKLRTPTGDIDVRLRDLSRKGALVEADQPLEVAEDVVFVRGDTIVPARVAWCGGRRMGIEFLQIIDETEVLVHLSRKPARKAQQPLRRAREPEDVMTDRDSRTALGLTVPAGLTSED